MKSILEIFEALSGLGVNFQKCCIYGLNMSREELGEMGDRLGCRVGELPINYLGLQVGGRLKGKAAWNDVVAKMERRIKSWEIKKLSMGGRITLVNSTLAATPIYRLSFVPIPKESISKIRSLQCRFLWGGDEIKKKVAWIKWENLCRPKMDGGLGIKNVGWFNEALLSKWLWRFLFDKEHLWARVIRSRHGNVLLDQENLVAAPGRRKPSGWWRGILGLVEGEKGRWFWEQLERVIGDGLDTELWFDRWSGEGSMKSRFPCLFRLAEEKNLKVGQAGGWMGGLWKWNIQWRRQIFERENSLIEEMMEQLNKIKLIQGVTDRWKWRDSSTGVFTVQSAYKLIAGCKEGSETNHLGGGEGMINKIWNRVAPFKSQVLGWRLIWGRLPTRENLMKRIGLAREDSYCIWCEEEVESTDHLFLRCSKGEIIWNRIFRWIGISWVGPNKMIEHFQSFSGMMGDGKMRDYLGGLWICVSWVIWNWRNKTMFEQRTCDENRIVKEIQCRFWSLVVTKRGVGSNITFLTWSGNVLSSLLMEL